MKEKISVSQMLSAAFLSVALLPVGVNRAFMGSGDFLSFPLSAILCMGMQLLAGLPVFWMGKMGPDEKTAPVFRAAAVFYGIYFLFMSCYSCTLMAVFLKNVIDPMLPVWVLIPASTAVFCFGAKKGIETLARAGGAVLFLVTVFYLFMIFTTLPALKAEDLRWSSGGTAVHAVRGAVSLFARGPVIPVCFLLREHTEKRGFGKLVLWLIAGYAALAVLLLLMAGVMGDYAATQLFPVYVLASASGAGPFTRLEAIHLALWFFCMLLQCSVFFALFFKCAGIFFPKRKEWALFGGAGVMALCSVMITGRIGPERILFDTRLLFWLGLTAALILPLLLLLRGKERGRRLAACLCACVCLGAMLGGCAVPLSDKTIVQGVCVEKKGEMYTAALLAVLPGEEREAVSFTGKGRTVSEAMEDIREESGMIPIFSHDMLVIFNASCGADMEGALAYFVRYYEIRPTVNLLWTESGVEKISALHSGGRFISDELKLCYAEETDAGGSRKMTLMRFADLFLKGTAYMPRITMREERFWPDGAMLFRNGEPAVFLNERECELFSVLRGDRREILCTAENKTLGQFTATLSRFAIHRSEGELTVSCQAALTETEKGMGRSPEEGDYREMERLLADTLTREIYGVTEKAGTEEGRRVNVTVSVNRTEEAIAPLF